jgi:hypothetical protein
MAKGPGLTLRPDRAWTGGTLVPGPRKKAPVPAPLPAGQLPPEDSRMWLFVPEAVQLGERFIQQDTYDWFEDRDRCVPVAREYLDHPRWIVVGARGVRAQIHNAKIASEVHLLVRKHNGLPEVPYWVPARMSLKQQQSDLSWKLTKITRDALIKHGTNAMADFAVRAPGQFLKFVAQTFIPKKVEVEQTVTPGQSMDPETADELIRALSEELKRRQEEAKVVNHNPMDYDTNDEPIRVLDGFAVEMHEASKDTAIGNSKSFEPRDITRRLNIIDDVITLNEEVDWDN